MQNNQLTAASLPEQHRQGDVLLEEVTTGIPSDAVLVGDPNMKRNDRIVARGEQSDHAHIVTGNARVYRKGEGTNAELFVEVLPMPEGLTEAEEKAMQAKLEHLLESSGVWTKEHTEVKLTPGKVYKVVPQYEFDPYAKARQRVLD